jgi:hypothetical protein
MTFRLSIFRSATFIITTLLAAVTLGSSPARADRCDDLAKQLAAQIAGLKVGKTMAGVIYLDHPDGHAGLARLFKPQPHE